MTTMTIDFKALHAASFAMSKQEVRYYLKGVYVQPHAENANIRYVATDGTILIQTEQAGYVEFEPFIMPYSAVNKIIKTVKAHKKEEVIITLLIEDGVYTVKINDDSFTFQPIDGNFPDYDRVKPKVNVEAKINSVILDADLLATVNNAARAYTVNKKSGIVLTFTEDCTAPIQITCSKLGFYTVAMAMARHNA
jgi:DNA polymerase III sliding clamp (beta) subunit (PCNA family)